MKDFGEFPEIKIKDGLDLDKVIVYSHGDLRKKIMKFITS